MEALTQGSYLEPRSLLQQTQPYPAKPHATFSQHVNSVAIEPSWAAACMYQAAPLQAHAWSGFRSSTGSQGPALAHYALFDIVGHARIRRAASQWALADVLADVLSILPDTVAIIKVLTDLVPGLPALQIVARPRGAPDGESPVPVDLRPSGGSICTLLLRAGERRDDTLTDIAHRCHVLPEYVVTAKGANFERLPDPASMVEHLRTSGAREFGLGTATAQPPSTTGTTTNMMSWAGGAPLPLNHQLTVITRHGPVQGPLLQGYQDLPSRLMPIMTHILNYDHAPRRSTIMVARVIPVVRDGIYDILIVWAEKHTHRVSVVMDRRLVGGDLDLAEAALGTMPSQLLNDNDRRHAWHYSVNGVAAPIWRRSVRHGDVIQVLPRTSESTSLECWVGFGLFPRSSGNAGAHALVGRGKAARRHGRRCHRRA